MKSFLFTILLVLAGFLNQAEAHPCDYMCSNQCLDYAYDLQRTAQDIFSQCNGAPPRYEIEMYHSDSCSSELIARVNATTNCRELGANQIVWGVKIDGVCQNITDMPMVSACEAFAAVFSGGSTKLYHSDSCSGELVAIVSPNTNCDQLSRHVTSPVWGVESRGRCENISDSDFLTACRRFKN